MFNVSRGSASLLTAGCFSALALLALAPAAHATVYQLNYDSAGNSVSSYGTVTTTLTNSSTLNVVVSLNTGYEFATQPTTDGVTPDFFYSTTPATTLQSVSNWAGGGSSQASAALGTFNYNLKETSCPSGCPTSLNFNVTGTGLALTDFVDSTGGTKGGFVFAANIEYLDNTHGGVSGNSAVVGAKSAVAPEPSSYAALLGAGLVGLMTLRKRFVNRQRTQG